MMINQQNESVEVYYNAMPLNGSTKTKEKGIEASSITQTKLARARKMASWRTRKS
jgi:hypothetical protein